MIIIGYVKVLKNSYNRRISVLLYITVLWIGMKDIRLSLQRKKL